jgi:hypothetical protein
MIECSIPMERHFTACASLAALGVQLKHLDVFGPIREMVSISQKTVKHAPSDKLYDAFISLLAGAHGLVEINTRLRSDPVLQAAFGRAACADQSLVQRTLDACTATTVKQMEQAMNVIYRQHSQGYCHDYRNSLQLLDVDMSGMPCGKKAAFARHPAILPSSAIGGDGNWGGGWPAGTRKSGSRHFFLPKSPLRHQRAPGQG